MENWKPIEWYEGLYEVSDLWNVKSLQKKWRWKILYREKIRKPQRNKQGYLRVILHKSDIKKYFPIQRLVAIAFVPNPENKPQVNHKNGIKDDNRACNVEWVTNGENQEHSYRILWRSKLHLSEIGKKYWRNAVEKRKIPVLQISKNGSTINRFSSYTEASLATGVAIPNICHVLKWKRLYAGGYIWRYE